VPTYCFKNTKTGEQASFVWTISEMEKKCLDQVYVDENKNVWVRDFEEEHGGVRSNSSNWPMKSEACAVHPSDVKKASEASVKMGVPTRFDNNTGQAIFESRGHRAKYLKARGFHDRNGGYGDG
tara:strand:- start:6208 stop:6579 length:372 start_codon:yes stop_codon:yes gene_type:complete